LATNNFKPKTQLRNFRHQNIGANCAHKMLMKSTPAARNIVTHGLRVNRSFM